jgi:glucokinase
VCILTWNGADYDVHASEGGHVDFAPADAVQDALLAHLRKHWTHVSYERVLSGPGLLHIFEFLTANGARASSELQAAMQSGDASAALTHYAIEKLDPVAERVLDIFLAIYGQFAGNLALTAYASGGIYIAGGIAVKIKAGMTDGTFTRAFNAKGRFAAFMKTVPLCVVLNESVGLLGAGRVAQRIG